MSSRDNPQPNGVCDVVTIGETLAAFIRDQILARYDVTAVGAESNVAVGMAQLGCQARWISRLGDDQLGHSVQECIAGYGVDAQVEWDDQHPTGICIKELGPDRTRVRYYRSQSAARYLNESHTLALGNARWIHVTGITPALSPTAADLVAMIVERRTAHAGRVSFDFNYRPALWSDPAAASQALVPLARQADVIFIGEDEAEALLGSGERRDVALRLLVRDDQELVIKRGGGYASVATTARYVSEPAGKPSIVDLTGAGDAFAAGYLAGACRGWEAPDRLRLGHFLAARVVAVPGDLGPNLTNEELAGLASAIRNPTVSMSVDAPA